MLTKFWFLSDHRTGKCKIKIPKIVRYKNCIKWGEVGIYIVPINRKKEVVKELTKRLGEGKEGKEIHIQLVE